MTKLTSRVAVNLETDVSCDALDALIRRVVLPGPVALSSGHAILAAE